MPISTPSTGSPISPKNSVHSVIIALAILNAVGMLVLYFKLDLLNGSINMMGQQTNAGMKVPGKMMGQKTEIVKPTENAGVQSSIMKKTFSDFMSVTLKEGETLRLSAPEDELGSYFFLTVTEIDRGGAGGLYATVTASDNGTAKGTTLMHNENWEASTRFAITVKKLDDSSITLEIGRNDNSPFTP